MVAVLISVFGASILGSLHCISMCGGFATFASQDIVPTIGRVSTLGIKNLSIALYNFGRLVTYLILGGTAAYFGKSFSSLFAGTHLFWVATVIMSLIFLVSISRLAALFFTHIGFGDKILRAWLAPIQKCFLRATNSTSGWKRAFMIGLVSTLLPCGWLYANVVIAMAQNSVLGGALVMLAFWLGTLPAMIGLPYFLRTLDLKTKVLFPKIGAALLLIAAFYSFSAHLRLYQANPTQHHCH